MQKTVLITGSSSGFGKLACKKFQSEGWNVIATMRSPEKDTELGQMANVFVTQLDVTDKADVERGVAAGLEKFGQIDVLINNAGFGTNGFLEEASEEDVRSQMDTNFTGVVYATQAVLPTMRKQKSGVILNITSMAGTVGLPMFTLYNASKFAVEGLSEALKFELEPFGIKVKTIAPGNFSTNFITATAFMDGNRKEELDGPREKFQKHYKNMNENPPKAFQPGNAQDVADLMFKCATEDTPNKNVIGKDAKTFIALRKLLPKKMFANILKNSLVPKTLFE